MSGKLSVKNLLPHHLGKPVDGKFITVTQENLSPYHPGKQTPRKVSRRRPGKLSSHPRKLTTKNLSLASKKILVSRKVCHQKTASPCHPKKFVNVQGIFPQIYPRKIATKKIIQLGEVGTQKVCCSRKTIRSAARGKLSPQKSLSCSPQKINYYSSEEVLV